MDRLRSLLFLAFPLVTTAQVAFNPQLGMALTTLTPEQEGVQYKSDVGVLAGADLRIGQRFYFQPGAYFVSSKTAVSVGDSLVTEDHLIWNSMKVKAEVGYNLLDGDDFRLRVNAGPTYNWLISATGKDDNIKVDLKDYNSGSFNLDAGAGIDLWIISLETGISYGLTKAHKEVDGFSSDAKFFTYYVTAGVVLGGSTTSGAGK